MMVLTRNPARLTPQQFLQLVSLTQEGDGAATAPPSPLPERSHQEEEGATAPPSFPELPDAVFDGVRLRYQRQLRGWTQRELADKLYARIVGTDAPDCGVDKNMVSKWERNEHIPSPLYRKHLCHLFGLDAAQLGFLAEKEPHVKPPIVHRKTQAPPKDVHPLRYQRLLRGWTQSELADHLFDLCTAHDIPAAGLTSDIVGRWELGRAQPSHRYRKALCQLFGLNAAQLGLLPAQRGQA